MSINEGPYVLLARILKKAQGVIDDETKESIDIGGEVIDLRRIIEDKIARIKQLEDEIEGLSHLVPPTKVYGRGDDVYGSPDREEYKPDESWRSGIYGRGEIYGSHDRK